MKPPGQVAVAWHVINYSGNGIDKKSLFWWYGHKLIETALKQLFHGGKDAEIRQEGQGRE